MYKLLISVLLLSGPTLACDYPPLHGPYDEPDDHSVDAAATSIAMFPALTAIGACAVVTLPADAYWKISRPQDEFGTHGSEVICPHPGKVVGGAIYLVSGFPVFVGHKIAGATGVAAKRGGTGVRRRPEGLQVQRPARRGDDSARVNREPWL